MVNFIFHLWQVRFYISLQMKIVASVKRCGAKEGKTGRQMIPIRREDHCSQGFIIKAQWPRKISCLILESDIAFPLLPLNYLFAIGQQWNNSFFFVCLFFSFWLLQGISFYISVMFLRLSIKDSRWRVVKWIDLPYGRVFCLFLHF